MVIYILRCAGVPVLAGVGACCERGCGIVVFWTREPFHRLSGAVGAEDRHRSGGPGVLGLDGGDEGGVVGGWCALEERERRGSGDFALRFDRDPVEDLAFGRGCCFDDWEVVGRGEWCCGREAEEPEGREEREFHNGVFYLQSAKKMKE